MFQIGWFSTGKGKTARDLLKAVWEAIEIGKIPNSQIAFVFCNRKCGESAETDEFFDLARSYELPIISWSSRDFRPELRQSNIEKWREEYDRIVMSFLAPYHVDIYIMAGYMLIASHLMCQYYEKIINLHPAKPGGPKGSWQEVIRQLIDSRAKETGCMMHLVTPELDAGSPVTFCTFPIWVPYKTDDLWRLWDLFRGDQIKSELFNWIRAEGVKRELPLIVETIKLLASGKIKIKRSKRKGRNLTKIIDKKLAN